MWPALSRSGARVLRRVSPFLRRGVLVQVPRHLSELPSAQYVTATATLAPGAERRGWSVTFVQRFSVLIGLHPHFHLAAVDGVFVRDAPDAAARCQRSVHATATLAVVQHGPRFSVRRASSERRVSGLS